MSMHEETPAEIKQALLFCCGDAQEGVAAFLNSLKEGRCNAAEAITGIHRRLEDIIQLLDRDRAKLAFVSGPMGSHGTSSGVHQSGGGTGGGSSIGNLNGGAVAGAGAGSGGSGGGGGGNSAAAAGLTSLAGEDPRPRLEWQLTLALMPVLAVPALQALHESTMYVLGEVHAVLSRRDMEDDDAFVSRAQELVVTLITIAKDIVNWTVEPELTFPSEMSVFASRSKAGGQASHNGGGMMTTTAITSNASTPAGSSSGGGGTGGRVWLTLPFDSARDAVHMASLLLSIFCEPAGWRRRGMDVFVEGTLLASYVAPLVTHVLKTIEAGLHHSESSSHLLQEGAGTATACGQVLQSVDPATIDEIYRVCAGCVVSLAREPLSLAGRRAQILAELTECLMGVVWHHVLLLRWRYEMWCYHRAHAAAAAAATAFIKQEDPMTPMTMEATHLPPPPTFQAWREQSLSMIQMETAVTEALYALVKELSQTTLGISLLGQISDMVETLLLAPDTLDLSFNASGILLQQMLHDTYGTLLEIGQAWTARETTKYLVKNFAHLPQQQKLVNLVLRCLCSPSEGQKELELELRGMTVHGDEVTGGADPHKRSRSPDRFDMDNERLSSSQGKRARVTSMMDPSYMPSSSYPSSMEDSGISSILPTTQASEQGHGVWTQRFDPLASTTVAMMATNVLAETTSAVPSASMAGRVLIQWLRPLVARKGRAEHGGPSGGGGSSSGGNNNGNSSGSSSSRGIEMPPCSVADLRSAKILLASWCRLFVSKREMGSSFSGQQQWITLTQDMENFCRTYLVWALSPGMQDTTKNRAYLEDSYPLVLGMVATLARLLASSSSLSSSPEAASLVAHLITLASGPWFELLAKQELWSQGGSGAGSSGGRGTAMAVDVENGGSRGESAGQRQIVQSLREVLSGSDAQIRNMCSLLKTCSVLAATEEQALRAMARLPHVPALEDWRRWIAMRALGGRRTRTATTAGSSAFLSPPPPSSVSSSKSDATRVAALEAFFELCARTPNNASHLQQLSRMFASLDSDEMDRPFVRLACRRFGSLLKELQRISTHSTLAVSQTNDIQYLPWSTLNYFGRLLGMSREFRLEEDLLYSFADAFDCFDLKDAACQESQFLTFTFDMLKSESPNVCQAAGAIVEKIVWRVLTAMPDIRDHAVAEMILDKASDTIQDAIYVAKEKRAAPFRTVVAIACNILLRLPEEHRVFSKLLLSLLVVAVRSSPQISTVTMQELARVANAKRISCERLVLSQINMVSYFVIDHLLSKDVSQYTEDIAWLKWMGHSTASFLQTYVDSILPLLFVVRHRSSLNRGVFFTNLEHDDQFKIVLALGKMLLRSNANTPNASMALTTTQDSPNDTVIVVKTCTDYMGPILAEVFMQDDVNHVRLSLEILSRLCIGDNGDSSEQSRMSVAELFAMSYQPLLFNVCLKLGSEEMEERKRARSVIGLAQDEYNRQRGTSGAAGVSAHENGDSPESVLHKYSLAIVTHINKLVHDARQMTPMNKRLEAIRCLAELIQMLQPLKGFILGQVLTTLRALMTVKELQATALMTMAHIIHKVDPKMLAPLFLPTVLCLCKAYPTVGPYGKNIIAKTLQLLIVTRKAEFKSHFVDLCALPQDPPFAKMNELVIEAKKAMPFTDRLRRLSERVESEDPEMAEEALRELKEYLLQHSHELGVMTSKWPRVDDLLNTVVERLLRGIGRSKGTDTPVAHFCLDCLGIIGAVDPARFSFVSTRVNAPVFRNFEDLEEAKDFVCHLLQNQLASPNRPVNDTLSEGYWGYAVQSLLAFCDITREVISAPASSTRPASPSSWSSQVSGNTQATSVSLQPMRRFQPKSPLNRWNAFSPDVREVLAPLVGAKYKEREPLQAPTEGYPFYTRAATFQDWMAMWAKYLISEVTNPYAKEIFRACRRLLSYDLNTCQYLLPHLVLHVFLGKDDRKRQMIMAEMLRVLYDGRVQKAEDDPWELRMCEISEKNQLGSQMVFSLLDHISQWVKWQKNQTSTKASALRGRTVSASQQHRLEERELLEAVEMRLKSVSRDIIAASSFRTKAYARSLLHHEQNIRYVRQRGGGGNDGGGSGGSNSVNSSQQDSSKLQNMYHRLQEIYVNMDEPDGMEGITGLVTSDSLSQRIFAFESAGRWKEAEACYTLGLADDPMSYDLHNGRYKCLRNLGDFENLLTVTDGDILMNPNMEKELNPYRIEASWQTQNWELLSSAFEQPHWTTFDTMLGRMLLDMRNCRPGDFERHMREAKAMLIGPLAAASMESYSRGYEEMIKLSMLHELEEAHKAWTAFVESGQPAGYLGWLQQQRPCLEHRLQAMVPSFRVREQMMRLRRIGLYDLRVDQLGHGDEKAMLQQESAEIWLQTARSARRSQNSVMAFRAILNAERLGNRSATIERAKWEFLQDERRAFQTIDSALTTSWSLSQAMGTSSSAATTHQALRGSTLVQGRKILPAAILSNLNRMIPSRIVSADSPLERKWETLFAVVSKSIERVRDRHLPVDSVEFIRAKAKLLKARWMDRSQLADAMDIVDSYNQVIKECEGWDKGYYLLGHFYLRLFDNRRKRRGGDPTLNARLLTEGCRLYGKALSLGPKYLFQSLPKLLTLWLDVGSVVDRLDRARRQSAETGDQSRVNEILYRQSFSLSKMAPNTFRDLCILMEDLNEKLPSYMFLSAFPQIISRMGHRNAEAAKILHKTVVNVLIAFPDQAIWQLVSVSRSVVEERRTTCNTLLQGIKSIPTLGIPLTDKIREAYQLCDTLITLCGAPVPEKATKLSLERDFPKQFKSLRPRYNIVVPGQETLNPLLPGSCQTMASHRPFREGLPQVECILDDIDVMSSLQRPRKITIRGSDGRHYVFLCKPKDDLRKDTKVVEVSSLVNMLLRTDREASRRNLYIRQYAVVPLNEECGLIEWVKNTVPFRQIIHKQTKILGQPMPSVQEAKKILESPSAAHLFVHELLPKCPSVFYTWLQDISTSPTDWFATRLRYTRTTAVMSMVGHILGLGDRHGENILFDQKNGDIVHVDFNCIFEQAKSFPKPEKVPFRLTHNLVDAFGISGCDGVFRKTCEVTLSVFRSHSDSFTPILEGFLHDPLVEWSRKRSRHPVLTATPTTAANAHDQAEYAGDAQQHDKAQSVLVAISKKLAGDSMHGGQPLSVEGQVEELIRHATHPDNLSAMYIGWSAYQ